MKRRKLIITHKTMNNYNYYYMNGTFPQRSLVDNWSRGVLYVLIQHGVQYVLILTRAPSGEYGSKERMSVHKII